MKQFLNALFKRFLPNGTKKSEAAFCPLSETLGKFPNMMQFESPKECLSLTSAPEIWHLRILGHWPMHAISKRVFFDNLVFEVQENVYEPAEDSFLFAENLQVLKTDKVLDMGTGCGILGIVAARKASEVIAVDISPFAVKCASENAYRNRVSGRMSFICGNLFAPFAGQPRFDLVLFNAPYLPSEKEEHYAWPETSWAGGANGRDVIDRFICEAPRYLKPHGRICLLQSTLSDVDATFAMFKGEGLRVAVAAELSLPFFESIVLLKAEQE
jgi:release factor glutamine methyltransferase